MKITAPKGLDLAGSVGSSCFSPHLHFHFSFFRKIRKSRHGRIFMPSTWLFLLGSFRFQSFLPAITNSSAGFGALSLWQPSFTHLYPDPALAREQLGFAAFQGNLLSLEISSSWLSPSTTPRLSGRCVWDFCVIQIFLTVSSGLKVVYFISFSVSASMRPSNTLGGFSILFLCLLYCWVLVFNFFYSKVF